MFSGVIFWLTFLRSYFWVHIVIHSNIATKGTRSLSEFFMSKSNCNVLTNKRLQEIKYDEINQATTAIATCGHFESFDLVLVTIPV